MVKLNLNLVMLLVKKQYCMRQNAKHFIMDMVTNLTTKFVLLKFF